MSESVYFLTICLPLGALLLIFGMKYWSQAQQARLRLATDEAYRQLAAQAVAGQGEVMVKLAGMEASLTDMQGRLAAVEKMLKEVE